MNEFYILLLFFIIAVINELIYFIIEILSYIFSIWTTNRIKYYIYFYFCFSCLRFIHIILTLVLAIFDKCKKVVYIMFLIFGVSYFFFIIFWLIDLVFITINFNKLKLYWKNCPYTISDLEYSMHIQRRCELYNIYNNSRYSFQYICSYDSSKDFNNKLQYKIESNYIICIPLKNIIENNNQINIFVNEYKNEEKFYCSRTDKPGKFNFAKSKDCNEKKYKYMLTFIILAYLRILFVIYFFLPLFFNLEDNVNYPFLGVSTNISEISNGIENFVKEKTKNIIIENKKEFSISVDIKNFELKNKIDKLDKKEKIKIYKDEKKLSIDLNTIGSNTNL